MFVTIETRKANTPSILRDTKTIEVENAINFLDILSKSMVINETVKKAYRTPNRFIAHVLAWDGSIIILTYKIA
jgi:hypothetical protein|nr:MAG TPA: hypothetical protein [Caudoviricetes sp.]